MDTWKLLEVSKVAEKCLEKGDPTKFFHTSFTLSKSLSETSL